MSAQKLSRLVAEAAEREAAPVPANMEPLTTEVDGITFTAYTNGGQFGWVHESVVADVGLPPGCRQLYVRAV